MASRSRSISRRLAGEATTVINAEDYGRTIYDLAMRRNLIAIGEDMVNVAYDAPVESSPRDRSRTRSAASTSWPRQVDTTAASSDFPKR